MEWSEELSSGLLQAAPDAILVMDEGRIVLVNDRAEELFGWPRAELLGRHAEVLLTEAARQSLPDAVRQARHEPRPGRSARIAIAARRRDGTEFPAECSLAVVETPQGRIAVAVVRDMTDAATPLQERPTAARSRRRATAASGWRAWASWPAASRTTSTTCSA